MSPMEAFKRSIMVFYWISMSLSFLPTASHKSPLSINRIKGKSNHEILICLQSIPVHVLVSHSGLSDLKNTRVITAFDNRSV